LAYKFWYVELWDSDGREAKWWSVLPEFATVRDLILASRRRAAGEIVRVLAPLDAERDDLVALKTLGAHPF
jgi:hypothetical protein